MGAVPIETRVGGEELATTEIYLSVCLEEAVREFWDGW